MKQLLGKLGVVYLAGITVHSVGVNLYSNLRARKRPQKALNPSERTVLTLAWPLTDVMIAGKAANAALNVLA